MLQDFLPRYKARFAVQPEHAEPAYRPVGPDLCLPEIVCSKDTRKVSRDNTVKYYWRILLLPEQECASYVGLQVKVMERPDGELTVRYDGHCVVTKEPPLCMGTRWAGAAWSTSPELRRVSSSVGDHHISRFQQRRVAPARRVEPASRPSSEWTPWRRTPPARHRFSGRVRPR